MSSYMSGAEKVLLMMFLFSMIAGLVISFHPEWSLSPGDLIISNATAHDICVQFTNSSIVQASSINGKLDCKVPSYDHSLNIIVEPQK